MFLITVLIDKLPELNSIDNPDAVRPGTVLLLRNCSIAGFPGEYNNGIEINQMMNKKKNEEEEIVVVPSEEDEKQVERMLLIGEDTVVYVWVPDEACVISADEKAKLMRERQKCTCRPEIP